MTQTKKQTERCNNRQLTVDKRMIKKQIDEKTNKKTNG